MLSAVGGYCSSGRRLRCALRLTVMSDCDSEDNSSSDDEDYVPSGGEYSEDDVNELVKEDDDDDEEQEGGEEKTSQKNKAKKRNKNSILSRKRKKGVLSLNSEGPVEKEDKDDDAEEDAVGAFDEFKKKKFEEAKKKREDDLWSSFLSDVGKPPKEQPTVPVAQNKQKEEEKKQNESIRDSNKPSKADSQKKDDSKRLTITKVFDFAGEEVRVTQEVDCSSREAKTFIKQQDKDQLEQSPARTATAASSGVKRPVGVSSILGKLGSKKQKMSTLDKSKLDWETFKVQEGIEEELARHNRGKDGYIDRKAFLERVDYRQFEREREIRLKNMKP